MSFKSFFIPYHRYTLTTRMTKKTILDKIDTIHTGFWDFGWLSSKRYCGFTHSEGFIIRSTYPSDVFLVIADITEKDKLSTVDIKITLHYAFLITYGILLTLFLLFLILCILAGEWQDILLPLVPIGFLSVITLIYLIGFRLFVKKTKALFEDLLVL